MPDLLATKQALRKVLGWFGQASGILELETNKTTVADTTERGKFRIHNVNDTTNDETFDLSFNGTDGAIFQTNKTGTGTVRNFAFKVASTLLSSYASDGNMYFYGSGQIFQDGKLLIGNPAGTCFYVFQTSAIATTYTDITLPLLTAADTFVFQDHIQTLKGKTYSGFKQTDAAKTANYTLTTSDSAIRADASAGAFTLTLPAASGNAGLTYTIIRTDVANSTNILTIDANSTELINGNLTFPLYPAESVVIECTGTAWECIAQPPSSPAGYYYEKGATPNNRYIAGMTPYQQIALITSTTGPTVNVLYAMPFIVTRTTKFDTISAEVTTGGASSNIRLGIYADNGNCYPGALIFDSANIASTAAGVKDSTITSSLQIFNPGLYWLTYENSATVPQVRALPASGYLSLFPGTLGTGIPGYAYTVNHTVGALPNPYTAGGTKRTAVSAVGSPIPAVGLRPV